MYRVVIPPPHNSEKPHALFPEYNNNKLGASKILFHLEYTKWGALLTIYWVKTLWKFCHKRKICIRCSYFQPPHKQCQGDSHIMEKVLELGDLYQEYIIQFNWVSKGLHVILVLDISIGDSQRYQYCIRYTNSMLYE